MRYMSHGINYIADDTPILTSLLMQQPTLFGTCLRANTRNWMCTR